MDVLKVSTRSSPNAVAGAVAGAIRRDGACQVTVIGAGALNQAMKALAIARELVREDGLDPVCVPQFVHLDIDGVDRTALSLVMEHRPSMVVDLRDHARTAVRDQVARDGVARAAGLHEGGPSGRAL